MPAGGALARLDDWGGEELGQRTSVQNGAVTFVGVNLGRTKQIDDLLHQGNNVLALL
jgi:hypothetical protein